MAGSPALDSIIGSDHALLAVLARARRVAPTRTPVLIAGESGTGKEQLARVLHDLGPAPQGPYVVVNCGALPRELAESELFGHERGAFTGAAGRRAGWFHEAEGGTLVLDEIGEFPLELQPKLLRALEAGRVRRVGGTGETTVPVRVVAMTLRDLRREARRGTFRLDLFHRIAGFELALPPLRQRPGDIAALAGHFLREIEPEVGTRTLDAGAHERLLRHDWPGNVRELRNVIRRAAILTTGSIDASALEIESSGCEARLWGRAADADVNVDVEASFDDAPGEAPDVLSRFAAPAPAPAPRDNADAVSLPGKSFEDLKREIFAWAIHRHGGSRRQAASALGISRSTFCDRVKRLGI